MKCLSCDFEHNSKYCPNCGEKAEVKKITFTTIFEEAFSTISNMDRGFLYNVKNLTIRPSSVITNYLLGKRRNVLNPISYLIISLAIYIIVDSLLKRMFEYGYMETQDGTDEWENKVERFIVLYFNYFWGLSVLCLSVFTKGFFGKYNFAEHLTINAFIIAQATLAGVFGYAVYQLPITLDPLVYLIILIMVYQVFKKEDTKVFVIVKSTLSVFLFFIVMMMITFFTGVLVNQNFQV